MKLNKSLFSSSEFIVFLGLLVIGAFFAFTSPVFMTKFNLLNILLQSSIQGIIAIGMTFVILTAGIDLSVGSVVALSGVIMALMLHGGVPVWLVILINLVFGIAIGVFHGFSITKIGMAPFIVTLATMAMARGLTMVLSDGKTIFDFPASFEFFGAGTIGPISIAVVRMRSRGADDPNREMIFFGENFPWHHWYVADYLVFGPNDSQVLQLVRAKDPGVISLKCLLCAGSKNTVCQRHHFWQLGFTTIQQPGRRSHQGHGPWSGAGLIVPALQYGGGAPG